VHIQTDKTNESRKDPSITRLAFTMPDKTPTGNRSKLALQFQSLLLLRTCTAAQDPKSQNVAAARMAPGSTGPRLPLLLVEF